MVLLHFIRKLKSKIVEELRFIVNILKRLKNKIVRESKESYEILKQRNADKKIYDKNKIQINTVGYWSDVRDNFFNLSFPEAMFKAIENTKNISKDNFQLCSYKPVIEFFSVNSKHNAIDKSKAKLKIFYTGEDVNKNYLNFHDMLLDKTDLSIGFDYPDMRDNRKNYIRYPFWLLRYFEYTEDKDNILEKVKWFNSRQNNRERFCSYVARHDEDGFRKQLVDIVNEVAPVSCAGAHLHNDDTLKTIYNNDKLAYNSHFMLNVCPENVSVRGYTTEKLFDAFAAGCIPVYCGSEGKPEDFININSIVYFDGNNKTEVIEIIKRLKDDENYYNEFIKQPRLFDNAVDCIYNLNKNLRLKFEEILESKNF